MDVEITVDGEEIPLNEFVEQIIGNMVVGGVESLKGVDENWNNISINIEKD
jgi:hypothetical protein